MYKSPALAGLLIYCSALSPSPPEHSPNFFFFCYFFQAAFYLRVFLLSIDREVEAINISLNLLLLVVISVIC